MISCVTFETTKIIKPIEFYETGKVHLIHYIRDRDDPNYKVYQDFYDEVCDQLDAMKGHEIIEHYEKVYDFSSMLKTVLRILIDEDEKHDSNVDIFVNLSSGTSEYVSAATIASMMIPGTIPFTVGTEEYTTSFEDLEKLYYVDNKPIGLSKKVFDPRAVPVYRVNLPDENMVKSLREYNRMLTNKMSVTAKSVIASFKEKGLWTYEAQRSTMKTDLSQKEIMYYQRHYIEGWYRSGWIFKDPKKNKYVLTDVGSTVLSTFFVEETK